MQKDMTFYQCLKLIEECIKYDILKKDPTPSPDRMNNILVYVEYPEENENQKSGWYSQNIHDSAQDLMKNIQGQELLKTALAQKDVIFKCPRTPFEPDLD